MANTAQAAKRARQAARRRRQNMSHRTRFRTYQKRVNAAIGSGDAAKAKEAYREFVSVADAAAGKKVVHANKAARIKSRVNAALRRLGAASK